MGQNLSLNTFTPDVIVFIEKYFPKLNIIKLLNNGMLYKTVLISIDKNSNPLILKIFFKNNYNEKDKTIFNEEFNRVQQIQQKIFSKPINNICPIIDLQNNPLDINSVNRPVGFIFRQYVEYNLQERIYLMPYLQYIEKIWITFQFLYCLNDLKQMNIIHGDLKPENILLTSNLSLYISDFATYKPAYVSIEDIADYTYFFGSNSTDTMKGCYLAPERFVGKNVINENNKKTFQMDVFSAGVIIAELFLESTIFDYTGLLNYKKGNKNLFNIDEILSKIPQNNIRSLIYKMIAINPEERIDISEALKIFSNEICPIAIPGFILHFNSIITSTKFWKPDLIIGHIYRYWGTIWKIIFGTNENPIPLSQNLNFSIINKMILESPFINFGENAIFKKNIDNIVTLGNYELIMKPENGEIYEKYLKKCENAENKSCIYIIIDYILEAIQYTKYDTTNILALEMLYILSKKVSDVAKLQLILPYFISNLKRKKYIIQVTSINYLFDILYSINYEELDLPLTEYNYFGSYVYPALLKFYNRENPYIILEFFNKVDKIIDLQQKFLNVTLKTRLKKNKENLAKAKENNINTIKEEIEEDKESLYSSNNLIINDVYDDNVRPSIISSSHRESILKPNKDKTYEIFNDYDSSMESFKNSLFSLTMELIGRNNQIDILIIFIRKLPSLLLFYGKSKTNDFSKFIINNFNKPDWIIQKEILKYIPQMTITIGEQPLNDYILPCMEMLITNNSNELKLLELIKSINQLLKMEYLSQINSIDFFKKLLPFLLHPNLTIKNEIINFFESLFNYLSPDEIFGYLYQSMEKYLIIPPIIMNKNTIINYCKKCIPRFLYQLEINNINYNISNFLSKENLPKDGINNLELLRELIENQKIGNSNTDDNGDIKYIYDQSDGSKNKIEEYKKYSLLEPLDKYIKKEIKSMQLFSDQGYALETKIFGKIFYLGNDKEKLKFPNFKNNSQLSFESNNNIISSDLFRIAYILKTLGISLNMIMLEELLNYKGENENEILVSKKSKSQDKIENVLANYYYNKFYYNWRPQGQIISTIYPHKTFPVEKLVILDNSNFCSFDNLGNAILYNIKYIKDNDLILNKKWQYKTNNKEDIIYKNNISCVNNSYFAVGIKKDLYKYNPHIISTSKEAHSKLCESNDNSNISCIKPFGYSTKESQKILFCTENGSINLYDERTNHEISLNLKIPKEKGIINCICESFEYGQFFISTLSGNLLKYDLRLNSLINDFKYYYGTPIAGINLFKPSKLSEFEFNCFNKNNQYIILWSGADEHEISFFNCYDMTCELLLKLNVQNNSNEYNPLEIEIPFFENINETDNKPDENKMETIQKKFKYLERYSCVCNKNKIKRFFSYQTSDNDYESINQRLNELNNIYSSPNTVQTVLSPFSDYSISQNNYIYENSPYIISAGNDKVIRYWDLSKDLANNNLNKSYIINAPDNLNRCHFTKGALNRTNVIQSNENYNLKGIKANIPGFSEFQNLNGILCHTSVQNEFDPEDEALKYCTKISDPSHKSVITDLIPMNFNGINLLISSSWDGSIKLWK